LYFFDKTPINQEKINLFAKAFSLINIIMTSQIVIFTSSVIFIKIISLCKTQKTNYQHFTKIIMLNKALVKYKALKIKYL